MQVGVHDKSAYWLDITDSNDAIDYSCTAAFLFRNATSIRYRQLQGLAETIVGKGNAPTYSAFQKRMTRLDCTFTEKGSGNTAAVWFSDGNAKTEISLFSMDSTGLKPTIRGDWMAAKWGVRRGFIKLHVGVRYQNQEDLCRGHNR